ncbi:protein O-mannosyl-transferase TMTC3 [Trichonephila inaurata madagascariensis]|uniref:Protein O-mannosyl-transferase TMTC3 n=1 Tax=Trichonephila inaurata madagascariensis TaxID=2747483 RepID=A0A8X7BQ79_9ARAC|nr:protein O-mannosyl-transferase TMTC3 [Trichonephila inaurata madagascariensis]
MTLKEARKGRGCTKRSDDKSSSLLLNDGNRTSYSQLLCPRVRDLDFEKEFPLRPINSPLCFFRRRDRASHTSLEKNPSRIQSIRHLMLGRGIVSPWLRDKLLRIFLLGGAAALVLYLRWKVMGQRMPVFSRFDNPAAVSASPTRQLTYNYLLAVNAWLLLFPCHLCCDWTMSTVPLVESFWDVRNVATIVLYGGLFYLLKNLSKLEEDVKMTVIMVSSYASFILVIAIDGVS